MDLDKSSMTFKKFYNSLQDIMSVMEVESISGKLTPADILSEKFKKSYNLIFLNSSSDDKIKHHEAIFQYVTGFYIYLYKPENEDSFKLKIIYKPQHYEEIKLYINGLKKLK